MREIRTSGSEGGGVTSSPYPYQMIAPRRETRDNLECGDLSPLSSLTTPDLRLDLGLQAAAGWLCQNETLPAPYIRRATTTVMSSFCASPAAKAFTACSKLSRS